LAQDRSSPAYWEPFVASGSADPRDLSVYVGETRLDALATALDVRGPALLVATACAAGASALAIGAELLLRGRADLAIVVGYDGLDRHTFAGFASLKALAPAKVRPFTRGRTGMQLGDGF